MPNNLREARNVGEWLEARLHLMFTEIADEMFGQGRLTRDERIALSSAIGGALDAFRSTVEGSAAQLYQRDPYQEPESSPMMVSEAAIDGGFVPLVEKAVRRDGTIPVKLIQAGWGSSGYYPKDVLERDGPAIFKPGVKMYWNHPTAEEENERPEGDLNALAAELVSSAKWQDAGVDGPGLYADAKVFEAFKAPVDNLAPHIGVSIRASGRAVQGEAEGKKGPIIQSIVAARSVDFVTEPGAGGKIVQMFEAARPARVIASKTQGVDMEIEKQLKEANDRLAVLEQENARLREGLLLREGAEFVAGQLASSTLPRVTRERLAKGLIVNLPLNGGVLDKTVFAQRIAEAVKEEGEYLAQVAGYGAGKIAGMGSPVAASADNGADVSKRLQESLQALGLSEKSAAGVVNGRVW